MVHTCIFGRESTFSSGSQKCPCNHSAPPHHIHPSPFCPLTEFKYCQIFSLQNTFHCSLVPEALSSHFTDEDIEAKGGTTSPRSQLVSAGARLELDSDFQCGALLGNSHPRPPATPPFDVFSSLPQNQIWSPHVPSAWSQTPKEQVPYISLPLGLQLKLPAGLGAGVLGCWMVARFSPPRRVTRGTGAPRSGQAPEGMQVWSWRRPTPPSEISREERGGKAITGWSPGSPPQSDKNQESDALTSEGRGQETYGDAQSLGAGRGSWAGSLDAAKTKMER